MRLVDHRDVRDAAMNLALEEHCVRTLRGGERLLLLYVDRPAVVIGKNQNPYLEADVPWLDGNDVALLRRLSGGGAVWHDEGNLNYAFVLPYAAGTPLRFRDFALPVAEALGRMGVPAALDSRNAIVVEGLKVSGTAQFASVRSVLGHGTLLFDADLAALRRALAAGPRGIETRAVRSVRSAVTNLRPRLPAGTTIEGFRDRLAREILGTAGAPPLRRLTSSEWSEVEALAETKYRSWDWNFGRTPPFVVRRALAIAGAGVALEVAVRDGRIERVGIEALAELLEGARYDAEEVAARLAGHPDAAAVTAGLFGS